MLRATIYGREIEMQGSPYTFLAYRNEFNDDLLQDVVSAYAETPPAVSLLLQIAWAMARTLDDAMPSYPDWLKEFDPKEFALNDDSAVEVIDSAINAELFRRPKTGKARRWTAKRVGSMAQRLGACADRILAR